MEVNGTLLIQIVIFMSLLLWLSSSLFKPILLLFDERQKRIVGAQKASVEIMQEAEQKSKEFDLAIENAKTEARKALSLMKAQAQKEHQEFLDDVKLKTRERLSLAEKELALEEKKIRETLFSDYKNLSNELVKSILGKEA